MLIRTAEEVPDEYRDLKLSVLFCGAGDVRIIAEVQIHDAALYALKLKVQRGSAGHGLSPLTQAASKGCSVLFHSANEVLLESAGGRLAMEGGGAVVQGVAGRTGTTLGMLKSNRLPPYPSVLCPNSSTGSTRSAAPYILRPSSRSMAYRAMGQLHSTTILHVKNSVMVGLSPQ